MLDLLQQHLSRCFEAFQQNGSDITSFRSFLQPQEETGLPTNRIPNEVFEVPLEIPKMLRELLQLLHKPNLSPQVQALAGGIYSYVFNPFDFINEESVGFLGFIDDALIVFYGMKLIEDFNPEIRFSITQDIALMNAVEKCEMLLSNDLIAALKAYPQQISGILSTADFSEVGDSGSNKTAVA